MTRKYIVYHELLAVKKSTTNGEYGAVLDCWVVPADFTADGLGVFLHDDGNIYNCLSRSSTGAGINYNTTAEFKSASEAYDAARAYCNVYGFVYPFALSEDKCYNLDGSSIYTSSQKMRFE